jgi:hypothetical protein
MTLFNYLSAIGLLILISTTTSWSQRKTDRNIDPDTDNYSKFTSIGITANTNSGILGGAVLRQSKALPSQFRGKKQFRYMALEIVNVKHPREIVVSDFGPRLIYRKMNYLFALRPQYGRELMFFNHRDDEGIAFSGIIAAGPTIGLEKPYMIQVNEGGVVRTVPYTPEITQFVGVGSFFQGFGKTKIVPGIHVKAALNFELSAFRNNMTGVEVGFLAEAFTRKIELMAFAENRSFYTSGYIALYFGSKK